MYRETCFNPFWIIMSMLYGFMYESTCALCASLERETRQSLSAYFIDSTGVFGTPLCLTDWIMYYPGYLGKRFLTTLLQVLVFWSHRLFILPNHCLHAPGQQQPCGD